MNIISMKSKKCEDDGERMLEKGPNIAVDIPPALREVGVLADYLLC